MDMRFQAFIEAAVQHVRAGQRLLWAEDIAERISAATPLSVRADEISEQIGREAARLGVAVQAAKPLMPARKHPLKELSRPAQKHLR